MIRLQAGRTMAWASIGCWSKWPRSCAALIKAVAADRPKIAIVARSATPPASATLQADLTAHCRLIAAPLTISAWAASHYRRSLFFAPRPVLAWRCSNDAISRSTSVSRICCGAPVAAQPPQIFIDAKQARTPRPRRSEFQRRRQRLLEKLARASIWKLRRRAGPRTGRAPTASAAMGIFRTDSSSQWRSKLMKLRNRRGLGSNA